MVPSATHPTWTQLIKGELDHKFRIAAASMLFFTLRQKHKRTPTELPKQIEEARAFFGKYEHVLAAEIEVLFR